MSTLCSVVSAASAQLSALLSSLAPREIYYIGGPEPLPAPLTPAEIGIDADALHSSLPGSTPTALPSARR